MEDNKGKQNEKCYLIMAERNIYVYVCRYMFESTRVCICMLVKRLLCSFFLFSFFFPLYCFVKITFDVFILHN